MNSEPLNRVWVAFSGLSLLMKACLAAAVLVAVVVLCGGVAGLVSHWKDARFDKAEADRAVERADEQRITDEAIKRAQAAEARAAELEPRVEAQKQVIEELSKRVGLADAQVQGAIDETTRKVAATRDIPDDELDAYIRAKLRAPHR